MAANENNESTNENSAENTAEKTKGMTKSVYMSVLEKLEGQEADLKAVCDEGEAAVAAAVSEGVAAIAAEKENVKALAQSGKNEVETAVAEGISEVTAALDNAEFTAISYSGETSSYTSVKSKGEVGNYGFKLEGVSKKSDGTTYTNRIKTSNSKLTVEANDLAAESAKSINVNAAENAYIGFGNQFAVRDGDSKSGEDRLVIGQDNTVLKAEGGSSLELENNAFLKANETVVLNGQSETEVISGDKHVVARNRIKEFVGSGSLNISTAAGNVKAGLDIGTVNAGFGVLKDGETMPNVSIDENNLKSGIYCAGDSVKLVYKDSDNNYSPSCLTLYHENNEGAALESGGSVILNSEQEDVFIKANCYAVTNAENIIEAATADYIQAGAAAGINEFVAADIEQTDKDLEGTAKAGFSINRTSAGFGVLKSGGAKKYFCETKADGDTLRSGIYCAGDELKLVGNIDRLDELENKIKGNVVRVAAGNSSAEDKAKADFVFELVSGSEYDEGIRSWRGIMAACPEGGVIELLEGEYGPVRGLEIDKTVTVRGVGTVVIEPLDQNRTYGENNSVFLCSTSNIIIENITFEATQEGYLKYGATSDDDEEFNNRNDAVIKMGEMGIVRNCVFREAEEDDSYTPCISISDGLKGVRIYDNFFYEKYVEGSYSDSQYDYRWKPVQPTIQVSGACDVRFYNNSSLDGQAICFDADFADLGDNFVAYGNGKMLSGGWESGTEYKSWGI